MRGVHDSKAGYIPRPAHLPVGNTARGPRYSYRASPFLPSLSGTKRALDGNYVAKRISAPIDTDWGYAIAFQPPIRIGAATMISFSKRAPVYQIRRTIPGIIPSGVIAGGGESPDYSRANCTLRFLGIPPIHHTNCGGVTYRVLVIPPP